MLEKGPISVEELADAKKLLVRYVQRQNFYLWFIKATGKTNLRVLSQSSPVKRLDPILVDGILRVGGRLEKAPLSYEARHSVMLPQVSHLTDTSVPRERSAFWCQPYTDSGLPKILDFEGICCSSACDKELPAVPTQKCETSSADYG